MDLPNWTSGHGSSPLPWLDSLLNCNVVLVVQRIGKSWQVNCGWVIAADLAAWTRLLGFCDDEDLREADPGHVPLPHLAHSTRLARELVLKISPGLALERRVPHLLAAALRPARRCVPGHPGHHHATGPWKAADITLETEHQHNQ